MDKTTWLELHKVCPICGRENVEISDMEVTGVSESDYSDTLNVAKCLDCGWKGMKKNLVPGKNDRKCIELGLRTTDVAEETYVSVEDIVGALRKFGEQLIETLDNPDVINYTQKLLTEIFKMLINVDVTHRKEKIKKIMELKKESECKCEEGCKCGSEGGMLDPDSKTEGGIENGNN